MKVIKIKESQGEERRGYQLKQKKNKK